MRVRNQVEGRIRWNVRNVRVLNGEWREEKDLRVLSIDVSYMGTIGSSVERSS
jgi:hypothetical protein